MKPDARTNFLEEINNFCSNKFKQPDDIERLIVLSEKSNQRDLFEETAFYSKYLQGLLTIIRRGESSINDDVFARYRNEYLQNIEKIKSNLEKIISPADQFYKQIFTEKYLLVSENSIKYLVELIHDLSWVKMYLNTAKRK